MNVPCPVPVRDPWSPVGYKVVETGNTITPPPEQPTVELERATPWLPSSPVGYKIVECRDEKPSAPAPKKETAAASTPHRIRKLPQKKGPRSLGLWLALGGGAFAAIALTVWLVSISLQRTATAGSDVPNGAFADVKDNPGGLRLPDVPAAKADKPAKAAKPAKGGKEAPLAEKPAFPAEPEGAVCKDCDKETFGTVVEFVRNPLQAARVAAAANKLVLILHVSGNFEDAGFT